MMMSAPQLERPVQLLSGIVRPAPDVIAMELAGTTVLLKDGSYFKLSKEVAARIWVLLRDGVAVDRLIEQTTDAFAAPPDQIARDVTVFLRALLRNRLIEVTP